MPYGAAMSRAVVAVVEVLADVAAGDAARRTCRRRTWAGGAATATAAAELYVGRAAGFGVGIGFAVGAGAGSSVWPTIRLRVGRAR